MEFGAQLLVIEGRVSPEWELAGNPVVAHRWPTQSRQQESRARGDVDGDFFYFYFYFYFLPAKTGSPSAKENWHSLQRACVMQ